MARLPRVVVSGYPHHVTQRGNSRAQTFFDDGDYGLHPTYSPNIAATLTLSTAIKMIYPDAAA
jgi:REP element-mobilizing transposase RayT